MHSSRGLEGRSTRKMHDVRHHHSRVEPERPLDKGTEWVVGRSTESVTGLLGCCSFD